MTMTIGTFDYKSDEELRQMSAEQRAEYTRSILAHYDEISKVPDPFAEDILKIASGEFDADDAKVKYADLLKDD
jgi:hypothetical protein